MTSPIGDMHSFALILKISIASYVCLLFSNCRPATIAWLVILFGINSVYRILSTWPHAHIFKKISKFTPAITDGYTKSAVTMPCRRFGAVTSHTHSGPARICIASAQSVLKTPASFFPAASRPTSSKRRLGNRLFRAAYALSPPSYAIVWNSRWCAPKDSQPLKNLTNHRRQITRRRTPSNLGICHTLCAY